MFVNWESEKNQIIEKIYFPEAAFLGYFSPNAVTVDLSIFKLLGFLHVSSKTIKNLNLPVGPLLGSNYRN